MALLISVWTTDEIREIARKNTRRNEFPLQMTNQSQDTAISFVSRIKVSENVLKKHLEERASKGLELQQVEYPAS